jgi:hypothetical protein
MIKMIKIEIKVEQQKNTSSDINEHINTLYQYGKKCSHITEMGVRWVSSTWPLIYSNPKKMISYDIVRDNNINEVIELAKEYNIDYNFIESDVLNITIEPTELLFIDTLHTYNQLSLELERHSENVSKYIILHDTTTFGNNDEFIYEHASNIIKSINSEKRGLISAVNDFLLTTEGKKWSIEEIFTNNNGLTILKRN